MSEFFPLRIREDPHQHLKVRNAGAKEFGTFFLDLFIRPHEHRAGLRKGSDQRRRAHAAEILCGEKHPRIAGMNGKTQHPAAGRRDFAAVRGPEIVEQSFRTRQSLRFGRIDPAEIGKIVDPRRLERENRLRHIQALDFRELPMGPALMVALRPKPDANSRRGPSCPPRALVG